MSTTPRNESELLQRVVEGRAADSPEARELGAFLARCRTAIEVESKSAHAREDALVESILASTTREDLGWRGDLRIVRGFLGERMRSSGVLRFAAASVVAHLIALPAVAWYVWKAGDDKPSGPLIQIAAPEEPLVVDAAPEELPELAPLPELEELDVAARRFADATAQNNVRRDRYELARVGHTAMEWLETGSGDARVGDLLEMRRARLSGDPQAAGLLLRSRGRIEPDPHDLTLALWLELWLDDFALRDGVGAERARDEIALAVDEARARLVTAESPLDESAAAQRLLRAAFERACAYGFGNEPPKPRLEPPVDDEWRSDLEAAIGA